MLYIYRAYIEVPLSIL